MKHKGILKVILCALIFAVFSLILCACGGGGGGGPRLIPQPPAGGGGQAPVASAQGYVYEYTPGNPSDPMLGASYGYTPVAGAIVSAGTRTVSTNSEGYFLLQQVPTSVTQLTISKTGFVSKSVPISLVANQTVNISTRGSTSLLLTRQDAGNLEVTSVPSGAKITLNGNATNSLTPHTFVGIASGDYRVGVFLHGYFTSYRDVSVSSTSVAKVNFALTSASGGPDTDLNQPQGSSFFEPELPSDLSGPELPPATPGERSALLQLDGEAVGELVSTSGVRVYEELIELLVEAYNSEVLPMPEFNDIPMVEAVYQPGKGTPISGKIDVYYTGFDRSASSTVQAYRWNAFSSYESVFLYDNLFLSLDEAVSLLFLVEDEDEWLYYQWLATQYALEGEPFSVVPAEIRDQLVNDPNLGETYAMLLAGAIASVMAHEIGHVNLGHTLQKMRLRGETELGYQVITATALNWPFELQADIFSAHAIWDPEEPTPIAGGVLLNLVIFTSSLLDTTPLILQTHPPAELRAAVYIAVSEGADLTGYLQPLLPDLKTFASVTRTITRLDWQSLPIPLLAPILSAERAASAAPELVARQFRYPQWFIEKYVD